jgi:hypothetical protein
MSELGCRRRIALQNGHFLTVDAVAARFAVFNPEAETS